MEIKLVTGETSYVAAINTLKQIDVNDLEMENIVVVPDSFSLQAENLIFDVLKIKSTFNIEVVGISRLASKILRNNNIDFKRISGLEEIFNIYQAVKECEKDFRYFNKCGVDFCLKILQIIKQFKGCQIKPEQIKSVGDDLLDRKMADLKLIYIHYENLLNEKMDLSRLLEFFLEKTENQLSLKNTNLFFINFDSFTSEINSFICNLAARVNKLYIGMSRPIFAGNAFIYEDDILKKTTAMAKQNGVIVKVENFPTMLTGQRLDMVKNLFSFDIKPNESDFFVNIMAKNRVDEIEFVAKYIKNKIVSGDRFRDFSVAVGDKNYYQTIKSVFAEFEIPFYCDDAVDLSETILGRYVFKVLQIAKRGFNQENFKYIVSNFLTRLPDYQKVLQEISYFNVEDEKEFLERFPMYERLISKIHSLNLCHTAMDYSLTLKDLIMEVEENYNGLLNDMQEDLYFKKQSENEQAKELILAVLDKLTELSKDQVLNIMDFENLLKLSFKSVKVETIPSYIDAVYVADATESYFQDVKTLFVLGATSSNLPKNKNDTGIIDDDDIRKLKLEFALEPEIKVLNRRSRLKLFELLQHAQEKLIVCTPMTDGKTQAQKAGFVFDLLKIFGNNIIHTASAEDFNLGVLSPEESLDKLLFYVATQKNLLNAYTFLKSKDKLSLKYENLLNSMIKTSFNFENKLKLNSERNLNLSYVSASALESYFSCPLKYFISYILKIKPNENIEPNKKMFGNFEHMLLKKFVEENKDGLKNISTKEIEQFIDKNLFNLASQVYDKKILSRNHFVKFLKNESKIILNNVAKEQKVSSFNPLFLEKKIIGKLGNVDFVGYVDRVDKCQNYFRILDYKTGKTESIKKELFYGKKLQLFLYANAIERELNLKCAGVYYFDCQTKYSKSDKLTALFNGLTLKDDEVVLFSDYTLDEEGKKSEILGMTKKKNPKSEEFSFKNGNATENIENLVEYATKISEKAFVEIEHGFIEDKPVKGECEFCPYISICKHKDVKGFRLLSTVDEENFKRGN